MKCPQCGVHYDDSEKECPMCGARRLDLEWMHPGLQRLPAVWYSSRSRRNGKSVSAGKRTKKRIRLH